MDSVVGRLVYQITGDSTMLSKDLSRCNKELEATSKQFADLSVTVRSFARKVLTGVLVKSLADAASELEELESKFNTVFGGNARESRVWAENYANSINRGVIETETFMATIQDIQTGYGMASDEAARFSQAVVGVTNDLASFSNIPFSEAMAAMQSGLAQQFEALRRLGIGVSVEIINQGEYAKALGLTWLEMDNLQRQTAIMNEIVRQSPNALHQSITSWQQYNWQLGDAAKTSSSYTNTMQGFTGALKDFSAELGQSLIPTFTDVFSAGTSLLRLFQDLPDPVQAVSVAIAGLGTALALLGTGPVGIVVSAVTGLTLLLNGLEESEDDLEKQTDDLALSTSKYRDAVKALSTDTADLTAEQKMLYRAQMDLARADVLKTLASIPDIWEKSRREIEATSEQLDSYRGQLAAWSLLATGDAVKIARELAHIDFKKESEAWKTSFEDILRTRRQESRDYANEMVVQLAGQVNDIESATLESEGRINELVVQMAAALNAGLLTADDLLLLSKDLQDQIKATCAEMESGAKDAAEAVEQLDEEEEERLKRLAQAREEYTRSLIDSVESLKTSLREDEADRLISSGSIAEGFALRRKLMQEEHDAEIANLEELIAAEEASESDRALIEERYRIRALQLNKEETEAYINAWKEVEEEEEERFRRLAQAREEYTRSLIDSVQSLKTSLREDEADRLVSSGSIAEGFALRRKLMQEEHDAEIANLEELIAAEEASESDRALIEERYRIRAMQLNEEETQAYIDSWKEAEEESIRLREQAEEEYRQQQKEGWNQFFSSLAGNINSFLSSMSTVSGYATEERIAQIEREEEALLKSLGLQEESQREKVARELEEAEEAGDAETAAEKARELERLRIQEETDAQIAKIEREQAEREKRYSIFQATIDTLASVVKFMVDPGGWAGLALSAMAAATGAAQVAAIQAQPLPSYDVGAVDISEDHIAQVHQGEMIVPKSFAEGIRNGDVSLGGANVQIEIHNYSGSEVSAREMDEDGVRRVQILIGSTVEEQISQGRYDRALNARYGTRRAGRNG